MTDFDRGSIGETMIEALIAGQSDPEELAQLAHRRIKASPEELCEALRGRVTRHHRFLLGLHLQQIDAIDVAIAAIDQEVDAQVEPFRTTVHLLTTIPGVHEPLPDRWAPDLMGRPVSEDR